MTVLNRNRVFRLKWIRKRKWLRSLFRKVLISPTLYKVRAYQRSDTVSIPVDPIELKRLTLEGSNLHYEERPCSSQHLSFSYFKNILKEKLGITELTEDILRTLSFYAEKIWNNAAALFADANEFYGIAIARFGNSINIILDRETFPGICVLKQFSQALALFRKYYQYEEIEGCSYKERTRAGNRISRSLCQWAYS